MTRPQIRGRGLTRNDLAQRLEEAERAIEASRQVRLVYLIELHACKDILADAKQRIEELEMALKRYENEAPNWLKPIARAALDAEKT